MQFRIFTYVATIKHDRGKFKLTVHARNKGVAREMITKAEGCPDRAILSLKRVKMPRRKHHATNRD